MTTENFNNEGNPRTSEADRLFSRVRQVLPKRETDMDEVGLENGDIEEMSLDERAAATRHMSDYAIADKRLFPETGYKHLDILQMARVYPENQKPLFRILIKNLMKHAKMTIAEAVAYVLTSTTIADHGEGRIDVIAISKGVAEAKSEEEKKKLGFA